MRKMQNTVKVHKRRQMKREHDVKINTINIAFVPKLICEYQETSIK